MSDFLHNLRNGNLSNRNDRPRKTYDNNQYRSTDRHAGRDKRNGFQRKPHPSDQMIHVKKILEEIQESQKELVKASRERAVAEKRMATALETIAASLVQPSVAEAETTAIATEAAPVPAAEATAAKAETTPVQKTEATVSPAETDPEPAVETPQDRLEAALGLIRDLRGEGVTYEKIARQLEAQGVPTVSGRGKWRGQAVSKLLAEA